MHISANGIRFRYEIAGETGPVVLLVHGLGGSSAQWGGVAQLLSPVCRLVMVDLRGHGQSDKPPGPYALKMFVDDLGALCDALKIDRCVAVGASMCGAVVLQLAAERPALVQAVVPVGGFAVMGPVGKERMTQRAAAVEKDGMAGAVDAILAGALGATTHATNPSLVALQRALLLENDPKAYAAATRAVVEIDVAAHLPRVKCPTLLLFGAEEKVAPLPAQQQLKRAIPHAQVRAIPHAGHLPFVERPGDVAAALMEFLVLSS
ncbi:MAG TPA: alpha/beta fold hydrolase [Planctomycetota bacterium]